MNLSHRAFPFAVLLGLLPAQEPPVQQEPQRPKLTPAIDVDFVSLRDLLQQPVHNLMALDTGKEERKQALPGGDNTLAQPVATIHDATFDAEGNLQSLLVSIGKRGDGAGAVVLPAREVRWHPVRRILVTDLSASQIAGLTPSAPAKTDKQPAEAAARKTWLGSELLAATSRCQGDAEAKLTDDAGVRTVWYVPGSARIGFVAVGKQPRLLPWTVVRPLAGGPPLVLEVAAPADRVSGAPAVEDLAKAPDAGMRLQCYRHFAVSLPAWDRPLEVPPAKEEPRGSDGK